MATRSNISVKVGDVYRTVYCHWDGYPSHNGDILLNHYNTQCKAEGLVSYGDISSLNERMDKPEGHSYENNVNGCTVYYGRDRGEENIQYKESTERPDCQEEYLYVFEDGKWFVEGDELDYQELTQEIVENN